MRNARRKPTKRPYPSTPGSSVRVGGVDTADSARGRIEARGNLVFTEQAPDAFAASYPPADSRGRGQNAAIEWTPEAFEVVK